ncbi:hypothetical protein [Lactobacillus agrestimuris]|uniref:hypothetical protein n=1 Tax=Lactobacillus agrestimuris TaxID=2941328 RepID=UPI0019BB6715|nr:hypothetical protein [Lactobacillus agrestimuris]MBD5431760.1 hypothetical protein [Lactobacillus sp.]
MKYTDFEKQVAEADNDRYEARLDRAKKNEEAYQHKNRVHIFDRKKKKEVAAVDEASRSVVFQDLGLPTKLGELINSYAFTPLDERMADEIPDDDERHNIDR